MSDHDRTRLGAADTTEPGAGDTVDEHGSGSHPSKPPPKKPQPLLGVAVAVAVAAGLAGGYALLGGEPEQPPPPPPKKDDEQAYLQKFQAAARSCLESVRDPDWDTCEAATRSALDLNPIDRETLELQRRLGAERAAFDAFKQGAQALELSRVEDGFELLEKIPRDSFYFPRAWELVRSRLPEATRTWAERCKKYASGNKWPQAELDCGWHQRVSCGALSEAELLPPVGTPSCAREKVKGCWTPKDETLARLLVAREKIDPARAPWTCPRHPLYLEEKKAAVAKPAAASLGDPALDRALALYLKGNVNVAVTQLQKLQERTENAAQHAKARSLQRDLVGADGLLKQAQTQLAQGHLEPAAKAFDEAAAVEQKYSPEPSQQRKEAQAELAAAALQKAGPLLQRNDARGACRLLKLGFRFHRANMDLLNELTRCSNMANTALGAATDCAGLDTALELSVETDGLKPKIEAKKAELACP